MSGSDAVTRPRMDGANLVVATWQDVEDIVEHNKVLQTMPQKSDWGRHIASIPNVIVTQWLNEEWSRGNTTLRPFTPEFNELVKRKLDDPNWKYLRTDGADTGYVQGAMSLGG